MKISLNWLSDFIDLKVKDPQKIVDLLTERSAEVERFICEKDKYNHIVVGEILEIKKHPHADKIKITKTKINKNKIAQIICGGSNISVGQKVVVALPGALIGEIKIKQCKIRSEESCGMICSKKELELGSEEGKKIFVLPKEFKVGQNLTEAMKLNDTILDIDNTAITNRGDLFAHFGFAREFVALGLGKWKKGKKDYLATITKLEKKSLKQKISFQLDFPQKEICPHWCGVELSNIKLAPSPNWMQKRLLSCGIRSINNIVDVTNYIMLEMGTPLHAFDTDKLIGKTLTTRLSKKGEKITTLDGKKHLLPLNSIIMEDQKNIFDLCGIMGGESSAINEKTKNILLHSPIYDKVKIRKTALSLNHRTDAAVIFEKGVPRDINYFALLKAVELILKICPTVKIKSEFKSIENIKTKPKIIKLKKELIERILCTKLQDKKIIEILTSLDFKVEKKKDYFSIKVPSHRQGDVNIAEDLAEEVARIFGFNNIKTFPPLFSLSENSLSKERRLQEKLDQKFIEHNFFEILTFSFLGPNLLAKAKFKKNSSSIEVSNPLSIDQSLMRENLLPNILQIAEKNIRFKENFRIFETGKVFQKQNSFCKEKKQIAGILVKEDYFINKGILENIFNEKLKAEITFTFNQNPLLLLEKNESAQIMLQNKIIGQIGHLNKEVLENFSLPYSSVFFIDLDQFLEIKEKEIIFQSLPTFPSVKEDISILAPLDLPAEKIISLFKNIDPLIFKTEILEVFIGQEIAKNQKSITLSFQFRSKEKTLNENDINYLNKKIEKVLQKNNLKKRFI